MAQRMPNIIVYKYATAQRMPKYTGIFIINNMAQRIPNIIVYKNLMTQHTNVCPIY